MKKILLLFSLMFINLHAIIIKNKTGRDIAVFCTKPGLQIPEKFRLCSYIYFDTEQEPDAEYKKIAAGQEEDFKLEKEATTIWFADFEFGCIGTAGLPTLASGINLTPSYNWKNKCYFANESMEHLMGDSHFIEVFLADAEDTIKDKIRTKELKWKICKKQ